MRFEIKEIQASLGITVVYVTHDQTEAMAMSDRIVVIRQGVVQQVGSPKEIYNAPSNPFVADFVGKVDFLEGTAENGRITLAGCGQTLPYDGPLRGQVVAAIRPETLHFVPPERSQLTGTLRSFYFLGDVNDCRVELSPGITLRVIADPLSDPSLQVGDTVGLEVRALRVFAGESMEEELKIRT